LTPARAPSTATTRLLNCKAGNISTRSLSMREGERN
jgi:hypothetical protein